MMGGKFLILLIAVIVLLGLSTEVFAQNPFRGDVLEFGTVGSKKVRRLIGNVVFDQPDKTLYADTALEFTEENRLKFVGRVRLVQKNNGATITGDTMYYDKVSRFAKIVGNVVLVDKQTTLKTDVLNYNTSTGLAYYTTGGVITDGDNTLVSKYGEYNKDKKTMYFTGKVDMKGSSGSLNTDTLRYFLNTKDALFYGPTKIVNADGTVIGNRGKYNTDSKEAEFFSRTQVNSEDFSMIGDKVYYNREKRKGWGKGNVEMLSKKDSIIVISDESRFDYEAGFSKAWGRTIAKFVQQKDTLYLTADTLWTTDINDEKKRLLRAFHKVKIFRTDIQGLADSLSYNAADSSMYLFKNPVLWNGKNQATGDTIRMQQAYRKLDRLFLHQNAFIIQEDTLKNYNQLKGRDITAWMKESRINKVFVDGNAQNLFFVLEKDSVLQGMNKVVSANSTVRFDSLGKISTINFAKDPEALFIPPHELQEPEKRLKGFQWRYENKPTLDSIYAWRGINLKKDKKIKPTVKKTLKGKQPKPAKKYLKDKSVPKQKKDSKLNKPKAVKAIGLNKDATPLKSNGVPIEIKQDAAKSSIIPKGSPFKKGK